MDDNSTMPEEAIKVQYKSCARPTSHLLVAQHHKKGWDDEAEFGWSYSYQIIQCRGCESISFRVVGTDSETRDSRTGEYEVTETLYPNRTAGRTPIAGYEYFPTKTIHIYQEVLQALNHRAPILAAIGLRALIESVCIDQQCSAKTLEKRIDELVGMGWLSQKQAAILHTHRFMGNVAAHEVKASKAQELIAALEIAETLLKTIYVLPDMAESIKTGRKMPPVK